jgi:3-oxoacyl-[acyl-carrier-protein] synthase-3
MKVVGTGMYVPPKVETAKEVGLKIERSEKWVIEHTGVFHRHIAEEPMEEMAAHAARDALGDGPKPDLILNASTTPRQLIPDSSVFIQQAMGLDGICSYTIHATCMSFLVALHVASSFVDAGTYQRILVVSSEVGSIARNYNESESAALFGDGAAAAVIEPTPKGEDSALLIWRMNTWPKGAHLSEIRGGGIRCFPNDPRTTKEDNLFHMDGPGVYKMARRRVAVFLQNILRKTNISLDELDLIVPHQPSEAALNSLPRYGFASHKIVNIIAEYGNCIAASMPMALAVANKNGIIHRGDRIALLGIGAGLSVAGAILRW